MKSPTDEVAHWVDVYADKLLNHALFLLSDRVEAEDMVQEVFLTALSSYDSFQGKSNPLTWLKGILQNKVANFYKNKYKSQSVSFDCFFDEDGNWKARQEAKEWESEEQSLGGLLDNDEFSDTLERCLEKLPTKWAMLTKMCYLEEKKSSEICQEMGITQTNYWKILQRSRMQLKECLELNWFNK